ncbi:hypothetical protein BDW74DRAFT_181072 [Aspergillus multicolor]|uniref:uncharacterized protein n=1 Tax=Aspergillus multicolor TaxID=41759 RepID=UPI003CCC9B55
MSYCGRDCQKAHWRQHKEDCKSPLNTSEWQPQNLINEAPKPAKPAVINLLAPKNPESQTNAEKFLWGNTPAIDVLKLESYEGVSHSEPLRLLFAASGDLRNVVKTIGELPETFRGSLEFTLNDRDIDVVARNFILLYIAQAGSILETDIESITHLWYSALVREDEMATVQDLVCPLIQDACDKIRDDPYYGEPRSTFARTWVFYERSLKPLLSKSSWNSLLPRLKVPRRLDSTTRTSDAHSNPAGTASR